MTRLHITHRPPLKPRSVMLGDLAIAAGIAGQSITLCYQDFPAPLLCETWRYHARFLDAEEVFHVRTQADLRKLTERGAEVRLVLVHALRLHVPTVWAIELAESADDGEGSRPAVLSRFVPPDLDEDPGATLVLRGKSEECSTAAHWLLGLGEERPDWRDISTPVRVEMPPWLSPVLSVGRSSNGLGRRRIRDVRILRGLLAGATVLRAYRQGDEDGTARRVCGADYEQVRTLLQSRIVGSADEPYDPLAVAMVGRMNVYLAISRDRDEPVRRELVTRREVVDLGNVRSRTVREVVERLKRETNGYDLYGRMGLLRRASDRRSWMRTPVDDLAAGLRPWSAKQVRTHFDRLRRDGMITAEREHGNGPWRYELPEELADGSSPFHSLPAVRELCGHQLEPTGDAEDES
jgi:hypothetical protein